MRPFYLRLENSAILIGDRDLRIDKIDGDNYSLFAIKNSSMSGDDFALIMEGTKEQCQEFLDWLLSEIAERDSGDWGFGIDQGEASLKPLSVLDGRLALGEALSTGESD